MLLIAFNIPQRITTNYKLGNYMHTIRALMFIRTQPNMTYTGNLLHEFIACTLIIDYKLIIVLLMSDNYVMSVLLKLISETSFCIVYCNCAVF